MLAKLKYLVYILIAVSAAEERAESADKLLGNQMQSKLIHIVGLQGSLGDVDVNATYKNIKTLTLASSKNLSLFPALEAAKYGNNLLNGATTEVEAQLKAQSITLAELKAQLGRVETTVLSLRSALSEKRPRTDCSDRASWERFALITVPGIEPFTVLCDECGAGSDWIVIQRRLDGSVDFYRNWQAYRNGFGTYDGEFFIGLELIHRLTKSRPYELYVELVDFGNRWSYAHYDNFLIGNEQENYMLKSLGTFTGDAGDALSYNLFDKFSTYDSDNDKWYSGNCANYYESGWWFNTYANSNLNGRYYKYGGRNVQGIWWYTLGGYNALKSVRMLIRPKYSLV